MVKVVVCRLSLMVWLCVVSLVWIVLNVASCHEVNGCEVRLSGKEWQIEVDVNAGGFSFFLSWG